MTRLLLPLLAGLALAGCDKGAPPAPEGDDNRSAEGKVLGGAVSDAMIPLDTVTSTPPPMRESGTATTSGGAPKQGDAQDASGEGDAPGAEPEPAAASEPAAAAEPEAE